MTALVHSPQKVRSIVQAMSPKITQAGTISPERLQVCAALAVERVPQLLECTQESFAWALLRCAQLGLEPDGRQAAIIPRSIKKKDANGRWYWSKEASAMPMTHGLMDAAKEAGDVVRIVAQAVYEGDDIDVDFGRDDVVRHKPTLDDEAQGKVVAAWAMAVLADGSRQYEVLRASDLKKIRAAGADKGPWVDWYEEMVRKSAVKRLLKYVPRRSRKLSDLLAAEEPAPIDDALLHVELNPDPEDVTDDTVTTTKVEMSDEEIEDVKARIEAANG